MIWRERGGVDTVSCRPLQLDKDAPISTHTNRTRPANRFRGAATPRGALGHSTLAVIRLPLVGNATVAALNAQPAAAHGAVIGAHSYDSNRS